MNELENYISLLRKQRHDFMNNLQVIYGYLQMEKPQAALGYIDRLCEENKIISDLYRLQDDSFSLCLENNIKNLWLNEVQVEVDIEISNFKKKIFEDGYNKKCDLVNTIFKELENTKKCFVYIYIFEDELGQSLLIANDESMCDEISWMDEWQQLNTEILDYRIYRCNYDNNMAYRLIFLGS